MIFSTKNALPAAEHRCSSSGKWTLNSVKKNSQLINMKLYYHRESHCVIQHIYVASTKLLMLHIYV